MGTHHQGLRLQARVRPAHPLETHEMSTQETLQVRVRSVTYEAEGILGFELVPMPPLKELPPFTAGAHK